MKRLLLGLTLTLLALGSLGGAQQSVDQASTGLALTLYSNLGLLEEPRTLTVSKGENTYTVADLPSTLLPDSVVFRPLHEGLRILEQEFLPAQIVNSSELLHSYLGQEIEVTVTRTLVPKTYRGILLSLEDGIVLQEPSGRIQIIKDYNEIALAKLPEYRKANILLWRAQSETAGEATGKLSYLATGLSWSAHYAAILSENEEQLRLSSWVRVANQTGRDYSNAGLTLIAGELRRVASPPPPIYPMAQRLEAKVAEAPPFETKPTFEYHQYKLTRPATLKDKQTLQLSFLEADKVKVSKHYVHEAALSPNQIRVELRFTNDEAHGLGVALPAGIVRIYKETSGALQLVGEDSLGHTPKNEKVTLIPGIAFDLKAERILKDRQMIARDEQGRETYREVYEIKLRNQKNTDVEIEVKERLQGTWKIVSSQPVYEKLDANTVLFKVPVPAQGTATVTYTVEWRY